MLGIPSEQVPFDWNKVVSTCSPSRAIYGREMYETWYKMTVMLGNRAQHQAGHPRTAST